MFSQKILFEHFELPWPKSIQLCIASMAVARQFAYGVNKVLTVNGICLFWQLNGIPPLRSQEIQKI